MKGVRILHPCHFRYTLLSGLLGGGIMLKERSEYFRDKDIIINTFPVFLAMGLGFLGGLSIVGTPLMLAVYFDPRNRDPT